MVEQGTEVAIFLDKSARPVGWMVNELWDQLAPATGPDGEPTKKPQIKFLNIDREQWGAITGRSEDKGGLISAEKIPSERIDELRELYQPIVGQSKHGEVSLLTDKKVLIIDEVRQSGDTLRMAEAVLKRAFPDAAEIKGTYWMQSTSTRDPRSGATIGGEVPVWYSDREVTGRLVANRDVTKSRNSNSRAQRLGQWWLSTTFRSGPDLKGRQLRKEARWLAEDLREHELPYMPSTSWSDSYDAIEDRIERLNGMTFEDYLALRRGSRDLESFVQNFEEQQKRKK